MIKTVLDGLNLLVSVSKFGTSIALKIAGIRIGIVFNLKKLVSPIPIKQLFFFSIGKLKNFNSFQGFFRIFILYYIKFATIYK